LSRKSTGIWRPAEHKGQIEIALYDAQRVRWIGRLDVFCVDV
jgi:hypothetical protein